MSIPDVLGKLLIETTKGHQLGGAFLMLGRQGFVGSRRGVAAQDFAAAIATHLPGLAEDDLRNPDNAYSETFFEKLGFDLPKN